MSDNSALFNLPPELRNTIYSYELVKDDAVHVAYGKHPSEPALLVTCKQIRYEALPMFYDARVFHFTAEVRVARSTFPWLHSLGPGRCALLRKIQIEYAGQSLSMNDSAFDLETLMATTRAHVGELEGGGTDLASLEVVAGWYW